MRTTPDRYLQLPSGLLLALALFLAATLLAGTRPRSALNFVPLPLPLTLCLVVWRDPRREEEFWVWGRRQRKQVSLCVEDEL